MEAFEGHSGLAVKGDGAGEVKVALCIVDGFDNDGCTVGLSYESDNFCMSVLAIDNNLALVSGVGVILSFDAFLEMKYNGTSGVNELDVVLVSEEIGLWRFAVGTEHDFCSLKTGEVLVLHGLQA